MPSPTRALAPVGEFERIEALDATRGFALVGIFMVNIGTFAEAFGHFVARAPRADKGPWESILWIFNHTFCEGRFYPLFSMLFGMGLAIQFARAKAAGRSFAGPGLRRLLVLMLIGAMHALLLWYGDILFLYGAVGLVMIWIVRYSARTLFIIGGSLLLMAVVMTVGLGLVVGAAERAGGQSRSKTQEVAVEPAATAEITTPAASPPAMAAIDGEHSSILSRSTIEFFRLFESGSPPESPEDPRWIAAETKAYAEGPYLDLFVFRAMTWGFFLALTLVFFAWHVLAMFCIGAGLFKIGIFAPKRRTLLWAFLALGTLVATPISLAISIVTPGSGVAFHMLLASPVSIVFGPLMSLGYLAAIALIVQGGVLRPLMALLTAAGRMAFTNYLMQTAIATTIFYYYGLGLFEQANRAQRLGMVAVIYVGQLFFSVLWLRWFTMGPLEWLWRSATYLRFPPIVRR